VPLFPPLVDAETLTAELGNPALRIFDATVYLRRAVAGGPYTVESGLPRYRQAHLPGAAFADIPGELSDTGSPYPFALPPADAFAAAAGGLGIGPGTHVVAYAQGPPMWATRLWWLLRFFGFDDVSVLDGGLPAWLAAGLPAEPGEVRYRPARFAARPRPELLATLDDVRAVVGEEGGTCLLNALSESAFRGEDPGAYSRPGRIPGSSSLPAAGLVNPVTNRFQSLPQLEAAVAAAGVRGGEPVIAYCGGGISATVDLFALWLTGRADARLYDGSLTEWSADPSLPLVTG
jgi:thiosulfate/3-mercaptopyruvate sulfurtransferase